MNKQLDMLSTEYYLPSTNRAFTIVELLVVVVVIAILAAITIVSFTGISQKAIAVSLQSDLSNASKQLKIFLTLNGVYPTANVCPAVLPTDICLKTSPDTTFAYSYDNSSSTPTFNILATKGSTNYSITNSSQPTLITPAYATGGTVTTDGRYRIHTFTTSGTLTVTTPGDAEVLIVGGGGGGSAPSGGGGGGFLSGAETISGVMTVTVGTGGAGKYSLNGDNGTESIFGTRTARGGGGGGRGAAAGSDGASGGGGGYSSYSTPVGGLANPLAPNAQGYRGGNNSGFIASPYPSGGGGGAGGIGGNAINTNTGGNGGLGLTSDIVLRGTNVGYAGGGAGGTWVAGNYGIATHGGGAGTSGVPNTGGGGSGMNQSGGSGIVIVRYLTP